MLIAAAVAVAGCSGLISHGPDNAPKPRYFQLELPGVGNAAPVPGQVSDVTATVTGVEIGQNAPPVGALDETFVAAVPGRPNAVAVGWVGGVCDARVDLELSLGVGGRPTFTLKLLQRPGACDLIGIPRRLILTLDHPVDAADFRVDLVR